MLVGEHVGAGKFNVTNSCRWDIPVGARFAFVSATRSEVVGSTIQVIEKKGPEPVDVRVVSVEFWRKPSPCIPYGHHSVVVFEGDGVEALATYLDNHRRPWHVTLESVESGADSASLRSH